MPSSWEAYYVVFLSAFLALLIPLTLSLVSRLISPPQDATHAMRQSQLNRTELGQRMNSRYFLAANTAMLLICLSLLAIPSIGLLKTARGAGALISILSIASFASLGLLYSVRKGDLSWLRAYRKDY